jgi:hypothetical protein
VSKRAKKTLLFVSLVRTQKNVLKLRIVIEIKSILSENHAYTELDHLFALIL